MLSYHVREFLFPSDRLYTIQSRELNRVFSISAPFVYCCARFRLVYQRVIFVQPPNFTTSTNNVGTQMHPRGATGTRGQTTAAEPDYPAAYSASREDMILCCLRPNCLPPDGAHITCTGVVFNPADDNIAAVFRTTYLTTGPLLNKAQQYLLHGARSHLDDKLFPILNKFSLVLTSSRKTGNISSIGFITTIRLFSNMQRSGL